MICRANILSLSAMLVVILASHPLSAQQSFSRHQTDVQGRLSFQTGKSRPNEKFVSSWDSHDHLSKDGNDLNYRLWNKRTRLFCH